MHGYTCGTVCMGVGAHIRYARGHGNSPGHNMSMGMQCMSHVPMVLGVHRTLSAWAWVGPQAWARVCVHANGHTLP
eukprot:352048-Chlamydomonas_euryale.AAC.10